MIRILRIFPRARRRRVASLALVTAVALAGVLAGCGGGTSTSTATSTAASTSGGASGQTKTLNVAIIGIAADAPIWLAMEKGYFADEGLAIKTPKAAGGAAIVPGVVSGQYDIGTGDLLAVVNAAAKGLPLRILAHDGEPISHATAATKLDDEAHLGNGVVSLNPDIHDAADMKGKTLAVNTLQSLNTVMASAWLAKHGVDPKSVKFLEVPFPEMPAAAKAHRVDAVFVIEPFLTEMLKAGAHPVGYPIADVTPGLTLAGYFVSDKFAKQDPQAVAGFSRAILKANRYIDSHEKQYRALVTSHTKIPPATVKAMRMRSFAPQRNDSLQSLATLAKKYGVLQKMPDVKSLLLEE